MTDKMNNPRYTGDIQEESLVNFMAAIGFEPIYDTTRGLIGFRQPKFARVGKERVSVNTAIKMHNQDAEVAFNTMIADARRNPGFRNYIRANDMNLDEITALFAGTCKIVEHVHGNFNKKKGLVITKHQVKFMTKYDERRYGFHKEQPDLYDLNK